MPIITEATGSFNKSTSRGHSNAPNLALLRAHVAEVKTKPPRSKMPPRPYLLLEANHRQLVESPPQVAVLPWGATEAHNRHLPYGTDVIEATKLAERAAELAYARGARVAVLPTIPFGNNEQQLDQACTISFTTATALAVLGDVARSLARQHIDRLVVLNAHGGN
ncbi:MAG TPA: creatininase family protein, partial [Lacipirellulaceae bacterium]|nr:creatininase family protein [Lacipirellulaceae bacterium]